MVQAEAEGGIGEQKIGRHGSLCVEALAGGENRLQIGHQEQGRVCAAPAASGGVEGRGGNSEGEIRRREDLQPDAGQESAFGRGAEARDKAGIGASEAQSRICGGIEPEDSARRKSVVGGYQLPIGDSRSPIVRCFDELTSECRKLIESIGGGDGDGAEIPTGPHAETLDSQVVLERTGHAGNASFSIQDILGRRVVVAHFKVLVDVASRDCRFVSLEGFDYHAE